METCGQDLILWNGAIQYHFPWVGGEERAASSWLIQQRVKITRWMWSCLTRRGSVSGCRGADWSFSQGGALPGSAPTNLPDEPTVTAPQRDLGGGKDEELTVSRDAANHQQTLDLLCFKHIVAEAWNRSSPWWCLRNSSMFNVEHAGREELDFIVMSSTTWVLTTKTSHCPESGLSDHLPHISTSSLSGSYKRIVLQQSSKHWFYTPANVCACSKGWL